MRLQALPPYFLLMPRTMPNSPRKQLHCKSFSYDTSIYPFKECLEDIYGVKLQDLHHHLGRFPVFTRDQDQSTLAHKVFYAAYPKCIQPIYNRFIIEFIRPIVGELFYYQVIPTFRIGLPGNKFVGEYHTDAKYHHMPYEVNFNLGLSGYEGDAALRVETFEGSKHFKLLECPYGNVFSFDHIDCLHGSDPNPYPKTMVSFDFRLALKSLYCDSEVQSVNTGTKFAPGHYFSSCAV